MKMKKLNERTLKELVEVFNGLVALGGTDAKPVKKFASKEAGIRRIETLMAQQEKTLGAEENREAKTKKISRCSIIRQMFLEKNTWTRQEIMDRTGFDSKNAHVCMAILRDPRRTKVILNTVYDKTEPKSYSLVE